MTDLEKALAKYDEWKASLVEAENDYDAAFDRTDGPDATPEDFDVLENFRDSMDEATRECFIAADTVISLLRQAGVL